MKQTPPYIMPRLLALIVSLLALATSGRAITFDVMSGSVYVDGSTGQSYTLGGTITTQTVDFGSGYSQSVTNYGITGTPFTWQNPPTFAYGPTFGTLGFFNKTSLLNSQMQLIVGNPAYNSTGGFAPGEYGRFGPFSIAASNSYTGSIGNPDTIDLINLTTIGVASNGPLHPGDTLTLRLRNQAASTPSSVPDNSCTLALLSAAMAMFLLLRHRAAD